MKTVSLPGRESPPSLLGEDAQTERTLWGLAQDVVELTKVRVALLVLLTTAVGYVVACRLAGVVPEASALLGTLLATGLVAGGAAAGNQLLEQERDARMERTRARPLPSGRMSPETAAICGLVLTVVGLGYLALAVTPLAAILALITFVSYVFVYTPLKPRTHLSTVVGAVPGALPPLIGWAAATGTLSPAAWVLFCILFLWQLPHFLAIAWLYREDYARAGYPMLTVVDPSGRATARQTIANAAALIPVSLLPAVAGISGPFYFWAALTLGLLFLGAAIHFALRLTREAARCVVVGSISYLALLLLALLLSVA